jgi:chromosome condensin MukBEF MukE localization factor
MENAYRENTGYSFLEDEQVEKYFADLNIKLLSGKHIQNYEPNLYSILEDYFDALQLFYKQLYKLNLVKEIFDGGSYYYLDFFDTSKGKLSDPSRFRMLTELQTILGLMLLDMYYTKYFDDPKLIKWSDIKREIEESEQRENYQRLLFYTIRSGYTEREWSESEKKIKQTINSFHDLGWVKKISGPNDELCFEINPSIHRLAKLYKNELLDFESFSSLVKSNEEE